MLSNATDRRPTAMARIAAEIYDIDKPFFALPDTALPPGAVRRLQTARSWSRPAGPAAPWSRSSEAGLDITGFDPSPEMLARCRARCAGGGLHPDRQRAASRTSRYQRQVRRDPRAGRAPSP